MQNKYTCYAFCGFEKEGIKRIFEIFCIFLSKNLQFLIFLFIFAATNL